MSMFFDGLQFGTEAGTMFKEFYDALNSYETSNYELGSEAGNKLRASAYDRSYTLEAKRIFDLCCDFLVDNHIVANNGTDYYSLDNSIGMESINAGFDPTKFGVDRVMQLIDQSHVVPPENRRNAALVLGALLCRAKGSKSGSTFLAQHFSHVARGDTANLELGRSVYPESLGGVLSNIGIPGTEAFGANIDNVLPDLRAAMSITLLQFHRGMCDRILHRRTNGTPYVRYKAPYGEVYDMLKSNDPDNQIRNHGNHYIPFLQLYGDPTMVSNTLQPIVPLTSNDTENNKLYADGYVLFGANNVNLFDLSRIPGQLGKSHYNLTDLVSENVALDSIIFQISDGASTTETFEVNVRQLNGARLNMLPNVNDSGIRGCLLDYIFRLDKNSKQQNGTPSTLLNKCTDTDYLRCHMKVTSVINLKYADVDGYGTISLEPYNINGAAVDEQVTTMLEGLTVNLVAYRLDACYSEENLRKSNLAIRSNTRTFDFEISNGRNIMVDYSFDEELPEFLMSLVTEATSLGQDHRALDIIVKELMHVFDVTNLEDNDPDFRPKLDKIGFQYVSSQLVRPVVYLSTINLDDVDTIRSSDFLGDIRQFVEWQLLNLTSLIYQNSFYKQQLNPGEAPKFKVITSAVVLDNLLSIPHIHNHLNHDDTPGGDGSIEYRRVLPNGTVLDCITCTYNYMRDKIVMIPYRDNMPESYLNFGHNWDYGTFVANYNPQIDNAVNKRVFANSRTMVIPTCPIGLYIDVQNISKYIDMFQITSPMTNGSSLPSAADVLEQAGM